MGGGGGRYGGGRKRLMKRNGRGGSGGGGMVGVQTYSDYAVRNIVLALRAVQLGLQQWL